MTPDRRAFSLIVATLHRVSEVERLLDSLITQTEPSFEVILVDQNDNRRLASTVAQYSHLLRIVHIKSAPGLSRARNVGLSHAQGEVVAFPDDDCWYGPTLLADVSRLLAETTADGVSVRVVDTCGRSFGPRWRKQPCSVSKRNVWSTSASAGIFLSRSGMAEIGPFDVSLGIGATTPYQSGEETDYLIRMVSMGLTIRYEPRLFVYHDAVTVRPPGVAAGYGQGMGRVLRKHRYPLSEVAYYLARPLGGATVSLFRLQLNRVRFYTAVFRGRLAGFVAGPPVAVIK